jgi:hypothetical protein
MVDTAGTAAPVTVVHDLDDDPASVAVELHLGVSTGTGVLEHVGERLLDDAVRQPVQLSAGSRHVLSGRATVG